MGGMGTRRFFLPALFAIATTAWAQQAPVTPVAAADPGDRGQRIEYLHTEDAGSRVDEQRYGGETRSIDVQSKSKAHVPPYQVQPYAPYSREAGPGRTGARTWKVLDF